MRLHPGRTLCAIVLSALAASAIGQTPAPSPPSKPSAPPAAPPSPATAFTSEPYIVKSVSTVTTMNADGNGTRVQTFSFSIQSDSALRDLSVLSILYSSLAERGEFVYARVVHSDGVIQETPVSGAIQQPAPVTREAPLYSDLQTLQLPVKSLRVGDILEWQTRTTTFHNEVPGQFWGQDTFLSGAVILEESYELRVPAGLHLTVWTNPRVASSFSESDAPGQHIYRWKHFDLKPTVGAEAEARKKVEQLRKLTPDEELDETKGKLPSFAWTTFPDWAAVGAWYRSLVDGRTAPDDAIKARVAELIAGKTTGLDKAQAIYNYVSTHIRYVGVDFGIGRYQPHTAAEVFANQYGDCKDKHILLASMLSVLNLQADPVLVGVEIRFNPAIPSPAAFNHVITRLPLDGKDVWLDSTAELGIWGALFKTIRDQDSLVVAASGPPVIAHTPVELPYPETDTELVTGSLDTSLTSDSKITFTLRDDNELLLRSVLRGVSPADYGVFIQRMMGGMGFGGTTSEPEIEHLDDPGQPLVLSFHYHRLKEKDWGENRITATFQPIALPSFTSDQPPTSTIQLGSPRTESSTVNLQLPDGWTAELPTETHAHTAFATCDITYSLFQDRKLGMERRLTVLQSKVPLKDYKQYQNWYDECGGGGVPFIQLNHAPKVSAAATLPEPKAPDTPASPGTAKPSDPKAADLVTQAQDSIRSLDLDNARKLLDQAAAINPTEAHLWLNYALIAEQLGVQTQVLQDMQHELTNHPEELQFYAPVVQSELHLGDTKAALATLRAWVKAAPESPEAALALSRRQLDDKQFSGALNTAHSAIFRLTSSGVDLTGLKIVAARAQVGLGQVSPAANSVAPLLKTATDPVQIDEIAHILADGSAFLTEAAVAESKVIADSDAATADWTVTTNPGAAMDPEARMANEWDTMALILFHLGRFYEALGYANAALHANNKEAHDLLAAINTVVPSPAVTATLRADDQHLRTIPLGPANGRQGVAFVTLLLGDGKVLDSKTEKSASPDPLHADPAQFLKTADLKALFPPASKAHLLRTGFVNCHSGICELVLSPFDGVQVINVSPTETSIHLPSTH